MQLDGYNERLGIAFEHQGEPHYSTESHSTTNSSVLQRRNRDDGRKYYLARREGVHLFRIPQVPHRIAPEKLIPSVDRKAEQRGLCVRKSWERISINWVDAYNGHAEERLECCESLASKRGGEFQSPLWEGEEARYTWKCSEGHSFHLLVLLGDYLIVPPSSSTTIK